MPCRRGGVAALRHLAPSAAVRCTILLAGGGGTFAACEGLCDCRARVRHGMQAGSASASPAGTAVLAAVLAAAWANTGRLACVTAIQHHTGGSASGSVATRCCRDIAGTRRGGPWGRALPEAGAGCCAAFSSPSVACMGGGGEQQAHTPLLQRGMPVCKWRLAAWGTEQ